MSRPTALFLLVVAVLVSRPAHSASLEDTWRLPGDITPHAYSIHLTTNVHTQIDFTFVGEVNITLSASTPAPSITLHTKQLNITSVEIWPATAAAQLEIMRPIATRHVGQTEMFTVFVNQKDGGALLAGVEYVMRLRYAGELRNDQFGFYRASYRDESGNTRWLATTQLASVDARHLFPCLDEPALRATFTVKVTHGSEYFAVSNMPVDGSPIASADGLLTTTTFLPTPPMPTYLVAVTVSDFRCNTAASQPPSIPQRVCARPTAYDSTEFALQTGAQVLPAYEQYFGIGYALPKMDQIAIPDFKLGAMENWGLVSYRELALLYSPANSTYDNRRLIGRIIAHEFAHQWFGNHVTPQWWSYIWLNEGFATLFEYVAADWIFPEWQLMDAFVYTTLQRVFVFDVSDMSSAMTKPVEKLNEISIDGLFDDIPYAKSGCVLRMFQHAFTEPNFQKGLQLYLNKLENQAAREDDLFNALGATVERDGILPTVQVSELMSSWTQQPGYPLVTVTRDYRTGELLVEQEQYTAFNGTASQHPATRTWWIPCNYASASLAAFNSTKPDFWLGEHNATLRLPERALKSTDWLLLNKRQTGYYRVRYDERNYKLLAAGLVECRDCFHVSSRSQLVDDAFDLARSRRLHYDVPFDMIKFLRTETEYLPWASAFRGLELVDRMLAGTERFDAYSTYMRSLLDHVYNETGIVSRAGERFATKDARNLITRWACRYGNAQCLNETRDALTAHVSAAAGEEGPQHRLHQDDQRAVMCGALRRSDTARLFDTLLAELRLSRDSTERERLIDGLACSALVDRLDVLLAMSIEQTQYWTNGEERYRVWEQVLLGGQAGVATAVRFIGDRFEEALASYYKSNINRAAQRMGETVTTYTQMKQFERFVELAYTTNDVLETNTVRQSMDTARNNLAWIHRNAEVIHSWIERNAAVGVRAYSVLVLCAMLMLTVRTFG